MALAIRQVSKEAATCPKCREKSACSYVDSTVEVGSIPTGVVVLIGIFTGGLGFLLWGMRKRVEACVQRECPKCGHIF